MSGFEPDDWNHGGPGDSEYTFVHTRSDLPPADGSGVIQLLAGKTYYITHDIDLLGDRLVCAANTVILGPSSENASLTSTGLSPSEFLVYSDYTLPIRHITFKDVTKAIGINTADAGAQPIALDWTGVNFSGCTINLECGDIDNFIFSKGAILGSGAFVFTGSCGTIGIDNSIFTGDGSAYAMIELTADAVITRRFRAIYSSFVAFGSTVAIDVDVGATVPTDSYILGNCNFSGGGTYLTGIGESLADNQPNWWRCKGIVNTSYTANYHMSGNATPTTIALAQTPVKVSGTTQPSAINQKFTHSNNRATYSGELVKSFHVAAVATFTTGNNQVVGLYIAKNGVVIPDSEMYATASASGRAESIMIHTIAQLQNGDYFEVWVENDTAANDITVEYLNVIVKDVD